MESFIYNGVILHDKLNELYPNGRIPRLVRDIISQARWQEEPHPTGVNYGVPRENLGRYNDPSFRTGICFTADNALIAVAESYGRKREANPSTFFIGDDKLHVAQLCTLKTTRQTVTIDMSRLLAMLHIPVHEAMGPDQSITQAITEWAANTPGLPFDGITYTSKHLNEKTCTAWWIRPGASDPLTTADMKSVADYRSSDPSNFPEKWDCPDITGKEMLLFTLDYTISKNNS